MCSSRNVSCRTFLLDCEDSTIHYFWNMPGWDSGHHFLTPITGWTYLDPTLYDFAAECYRLERGIILLLSMLIKLSTNILQITHGRYVYHNYLSKWYIHDAYSDHDDVSSSMRYVYFWSVGHEIHLTWIFSSAKVSSFLRRNCPRSSRPCSGVSGYPLLKYRSEAPVNWFKVV